MEISEKEYYELMTQVRALKDQVEAIQSPRKTTLLDMVNERVISDVRNISDEEPIFGYSYLASDAWTVMLQLAKMIHNPSRLFYMDRRYGQNRFCTRPYINSMNAKNPPRKIADLTADQVNVSVQMLNEIIPIYNKYFKMMHRKVMYDPTGKGDYEPIGVVDNDALNQDGCEASAMGEIYG